MRLAQNWKCSWDKNQTGGRNVVRLFKVTTNYFGGKQSLNHWITMSVVVFGKIRNLK